MPTKYSLQIARVSTPVDATKCAVGTGFIIENTSSTNDITFLTNAHVVAPGQKHFIEMAWCKPLKIPVSVVAICYDRDLSLLSCPRELWEAAVDEHVCQTDEAAYIKSAPPLKLGTQDMLCPIGTAVCCQGHPLGLPTQQLSWGQTRGVYNMPNGEQRYLIQAPINHGNSGGPVFVTVKDNRYVIGVSTMKLSGQQVEGEGGIITVMEMKALLPSLLSVLDVKTPQDKEKHAMFLALLSKMGLQVAKDGSLHQIPHENAKWLSDNWKEFTSKWDKMALGGRVGGIPRSFNGWFMRHIIDNEKKPLYNGMHLLAMVLELAKNNNYDAIHNLKTQGWKTTRLAAVNNIVKLNLNNLGKEKMPHLIHAPILGWSNIQAVQDIDYHEYYGISDTDKINGFIVNTVLPNSLYDKGNGKEGDLIYAFSVHRMKNGKLFSKIYNKKMLDKEGHFSPDGSSLGSRLSLSSALHHLPWENHETKESYQVICHIMRKGGIATNVVFTIAQPELDDLPPMHKVLPFNDESKNAKGCKLNGLTLAQCNENYIETLKLTDYVDISERYKFKIICLNSTRQKIFPGSTMTKLNGVDTSTFKNWDDFTKACMEFHDSLQSDNPPKYWTAEFARPGFKCKVINKI